MMKERPNPEQLPEGMKTTKDVFREAGTLEKGQKLREKYWLATQKGAPVVTEEESTPTRRVYEFGMNDEGVFEAQEFSEVDGILSPRGEPYTYMELGPRVKGLGAAGFMPYLEPEKVAPPSETKWARSETIKEQRKREIRESSIAYEQMMNDLRRDLAKMRVNNERLEQIRLFERIVELPPGESDEKAERGIVLQQGKTLLPDVRPDISDPTQLRPTLIIRLMHKTQSLIEGKTTTTLESPQIETLTALVDEVKRLEEETSPLLKVLKAKGIEIVRIEVGSWRERAGEIYQLNVPIRVLSIVNLSEK